MAQRLRGRHGYSADAPFTVTMHSERLLVPIHWRKPRMIFVCSMGDLFHPQVSLHFIHKVFAVMAMGFCAHHIFQILTKRPDRMAYFANTYVDRDVGDGKTTWGMRWPQNVWAGTSVESAKYLPRLDMLAGVPAKVRFVSCEPLLGPLNLIPWLDTYDGIHTLFERVGSQVHFVGQPLHWVIVGGESGSGYRPMETQWVESIVHFCGMFHVPVFVKQASGLLPGMQGDLPDDLWGVKERPCP